MKLIQRCISLVFIFSISVTTFTSCSEEEGISEPALTAPETNAGLNSTTVVSGFTTDFSSWLQSNGYGSYQFDRSDITDDCYGGKAFATEQLNQDPVIFIHGNSNKALDWTPSIEYFLGQGYGKRELYAITWGPDDASQASSQYHSKPYLERIRAFIQAVKAYTGASKIDVIGHSMGVTLARKAIKGGTAYDGSNGGYYNLGSPLTSSVDTFVGIAGANFGLTACYYSSGTKTCNDVNGFYPGYLWWGQVIGVSDLLTDLNSTSGYEGSHVYTIWSTADQIIGYGCVVYGRYTTQINGQDGEKRFYSAPYGHFNSKDLTGYYQLRMVRDHSTF